VGWRSYLPFDPGDRLLVEARLGFAVIVRGRAEVAACDDTLELGFDFPARKVFMRRLPAVTGWLRVQPPEPDGLCPAEAHVEGQPPAAGRLRIQDLSEGRRVELDDADDEGRPQTYGLTATADGEGRARLIRVVGLPAVASGLFVTIRADRAP
jgi:hypothetical protein